MKRKKAKEIVKKIEKVWRERHPNQEKKLKIRLKQLEKVIKLSPHDDGLMRVQSMETKKVHLVPMEEIILNGLKGSDLPKYPTEGGNNVRNAK